MQNSIPQKIFLTLAAFIAWFAISLQLVLILQNRVASVPETIVRFFSYFTILTNIIVAISFTTNLLGSKGNQNSFWFSNSGKTAILIYILVVGIVYNLVLRQLWTPSGLQKIADELLHVATPLLYLLYWIVFTPKQLLQWKFAFQWLLYPFIYLVYILVRGAFSNFYPYPFVDVFNHGYQKVLVNSFYVLLLFLVLSAVFIATTRLLSGKKVTG
jgi:hypothetical protein